MAKGVAGAPRAVLAPLRPPLGRVPPGGLILFDLPERRRILDIIIGTVFVAAVGLGLFDLQFETFGSVVTLFALALLCPFVYLLNKRGRFTAAALLLVVGALLVIGSNLYDGDGIRDSGILAYPIVIMVGALLFGKRTAPLFALGAVASVTLVFLFERGGLIRPTLGPTDAGSLIPVVVLLLAATVVIWIVADILEKNLARARASEAELRVNYDLTLDAWARVLEYRHRETEGHSRRVVELSARLARCLGFGEPEIVALRRGALLHDIGKLAIPDEILLKPGALDDEERRVIREHPDAAREMLAGIPFLEPSICVAYSHHERWDGQGYPLGLKGEEIPYAARIFAVVDAWDALCSERAYRPAWPPDRALAYIKEKSGTVFDPRVVEEFVRIVEEPPRAEAEEGS